MNNQVSVSVVVVLLFFSCKQNSPIVIEELPLDNTYCKTTPQLLFASLGYGDTDQIVKIDHPRIVYADEPSELPRIQPNHNRVTAGELMDNTLEVDLNVEWGDFYFEDESRPGLRMVAIGEKGKLPSIPAPMIRVREGTRVKATISNSLPDSTLTIFGFQERPSDLLDSLVLTPGESGKIEFEAGKPGTYMYWIRLGAKVNRFIREDEQLSGAFIIDPMEGSPPDRVIVMNAFSTPKGKPIMFGPTYEALTMNGKSWPYSELFEFEVGDTITWRIINSSRRNHPMHLHGFYYDVLSKGGMLVDEIHPDNEVSEVVTDFMSRQSTLKMRWVATRPGRWLFHCHLSFHVTSEIRIPDGLDHGEHEHMAGLVVGIDIKPGPSDLKWEGEDLNIELYANSYKSEGRPLNGFSYSPDQITEGNLTAPGPAMILTQYQPTYVTVKNRMNIPTSVHWHGLEIDSWADGVPDWSSSDGKTSPTVKPGESFTYKLSLMRAGSFIYHSHLDDIHQLTTGLYGPLIVLPKGEVFDAETDHYYMVSWRDPDPAGLKSLIEVNGDTALQDFSTKIGTQHRLRLMNIAPAGRASISVEKNGEKIPIRIIAKDGADLPVPLQQEVTQSFRYGVGETADFQFEPKVKGVYHLVVSAFGHKWRQKWVVNDR